MTKTFLQQAEEFLEGAAFYGPRDAIISFAQHLDSQKASEHQTVTLSLICSTHGNGLPGPWCTKDCDIRSLGQKEQEKQQRIEPVVWPISLHNENLTILKIADRIDALIEAHNNSL